MNCNLQLNFRFYLHSWMPENQSSVTHKFSVRNAQKRIHTLKANI